MEGLWELPKSPFTSHSHHPWQKGHGWSQATARDPFNLLPEHIVPQTLMNCKCSMRNIFLVLILMYLLKRKMAASIREAAFMSCFVFHLLPSVERWNRVANQGETWHRWITLQQAGPEEQLGPLVVIETHNAFILLSQWLLVFCWSVNSIPPHCPVYPTPTRCTLENGFRLPHVVVQNTPPNVSRESSTQVNLRDTEILSTPLSRLQTLYVNR